MNICTFFRHAFAMAATCAAAAATLQSTAEVQDENALPSPMSLNQALAYAAVHNPGLKLAREQVKEQQGILIEVSSPYLPALTATGFGSRTQDRLQQIPGYVSEAWQFKVTATQLLYDGGTTNYGKGAQKEQIEVARLNYTAQQQDVILKVRESYYTVLLNKELIDVREEAIDVLKTVLQQAKERFGAGTGTKFDVTRAEASLANALPPLIQARNDYKVSQDRLLTILGLKADNLEHAELVLGDSFNYSDTTPSLGSAIDTAAAKRVELARQDHLIEAARLGRKAVRGSSRPRVSAYAGYEYTGDYTSSEFDDSIPGWSFGIQAGWTFLDGREREGRALAAESRREQARLARDQLLLGINLEVRQSYSTVTESRQLLDAASKTLEQAQESLRLAQASAREGRATQLDVLTAQSTLTEARSSMSRAKFECAVADARLQRAMGVELF